MKFLKYLFLLICFFGWGQTPTVTVDQKFDWATNTTNAVARFLLTDEICPAGGLSINYTISGGGASFINQSSGSISFLEGEFKKELIIAKNTTVTGIQEFTITITSGTGYIIEPNDVFVVGGVAKFKVAEELPIASFPGAQGAGAFTPGGRGGTVLHVTSLADDGSPGTYRWAVQQNYPRIIVFDVSGVIELQTALDIVPPPFMTIAGQTAPEGGITIRHQLGHYLKRSNDIIIRYVRFEADQFANGQTATAKASLYTDGTSNIIMDHCNFRFAANTAALSTWDDLYEQDNVTVQWSHLSSSATGHLMGSAPSLVDRREFAGKNSSHHNLFTHISHRFPNINGSGFFEVVNNVAYNPFFRGSSVYNAAEAHIIGMYSRRYSSYSTQHAIATGEYLFGFEFPENDFRIYLENNRLEADGGVTYDEQYDSWIGTVLKHPGSSGIVYRQADSIPFKSDVRMFTKLGIPITEQMPLDAFDDIVADVGANKYLNEDGTYGTYRDTIDVRYINDAINRTCVTCNGESRPSVSDRSILYYNLPTNTRPVGYDTDNDGMPNVWENANGLNPDLDDSAGLDLDSNYTNIEMFINSVDAIQSPVPVTGINWNNNSQIVNVGGFLDLSYTFSPLNASNQGFTLSSSNTSVISNTGAVVGAGTAILTITTNDGGFTDTIDVMVNALPNPTPPVKRIGNGKFLLIDY